MREAIKISREFLRAPSLANFVLGPFGGSYAILSQRSYHLTPEDLASINTDEALEAYIRRNTGSIHHAVGTARMSSRTSNGGVVDPDLRVKGTYGLRVIDASIFVSILYGFNIKVLRACSLSRQGPIQWHPYTLLQSEERTF